MILYGLPTCTSCKRALKDLAEAHITPTFRDIRAEPLTEAEWAPLLAEFGDNLIDRSSQERHSYTHQKAVKQRG